MPKTEPFKTPYARPMAVHCPECGRIMAVVTRTIEKPDHSSPLTWSCGSCKKSWSVPATLVECVAVDYDDGSR